MDKLKKIGLTALAGSLAAATAAQAEVTWSGNATVTYMDDDSVNTSTKSLSNGNALGQNTNITFSNSGELENGFTVSIVGYFNDADGTSVSSTNMKLGMGDMGTIVFAEVGGTAANGIDDVLPTAYEEVWDASTSNFHTFGAVTNSGSIEYQTPTVDFGGISMSATAAYDPQGGVKNRDHDAVTAAGGTYQSGRAYTVKFGWEGLTIGGGHENVEGNTSTDPEYNTATGYAKYSMGPVTIGYQEVYVDSAAGAADYEGDGYGVTFAVNDDLTVGYTVENVTKKEITGGNSAATAAVEQENKGISASYTTGGMTFAIIQVDVDNAGYSSTTTGEHTEIALSFAF